MAIRVLLLTHILFPLALNMAQAAPRAKIQSTSGPGFVRFTKKINPGELQKELVAANFAISFIECSQHNCTIHLAAGETKNPMPIVERHAYVDFDALRRKQLSTIEMLYEKWDAGTITSEEKDVLIKKLVAHILGR